MFPTSFARPSFIISGKSVRNSLLTSNLLARLTRLSMESKRPSSDLAAFREIFSKAKNIVVLTGAGISAESGVPTFRGPGGFWRKWQAQDLASPTAFRTNPSLVWEFYHYRRELMGSKEPNKAHYAIAECEKRLEKQGRNVSIVTQNIDGLHYRAGSSRITELHGNLFKTRCTKCGEVAQAKVALIQKPKDAAIPVELLPRCKKDSCKGLLRPHVVWFGESLDPVVLMKTEEILEKCDLCLVVGTSSIVYPAAMYAPMVARQDIITIIIFSPHLSLFLSLSLSLSLFHYRHHHYNNFLSTSLTLSLSLFHYRHHYNHFLSTSLSLSLSLFHYRHHHYNHFLSTSLTLSLSFIIDIITIIIFSPHLSSFSLSFHYRHHHYNHFLSTSHFSLSLSLSLFIIDIITIIIFSPHLSFFSLFHYRHHHYNHFSFHYSLTLSLIIDITIIIFSPPVSLSFSL
ncbi:SIRT5 [Acanthosepion pharaonis]|uniref:NAD-dependent protein deacylase n=1 Tax=Acanthosepion pharaonis TaxID=158019 RepID=A0A812EB46_ACAPH|nr:SIRT5 [Sepia pharaonis]